MTKKIHYGNVKQGVKKGGYMTKFENVLNDLPGCGKTSLPHKFTMNRGKGTVGSLKPSIGITFSAKKELSLTLPTLHIGGDMKKKPFEKKLLLNKTTMANLDFEKMRKVYGGVDTVAGYQTIEKICAIYSCADACTLWVPICG